MNAVASLLQRTCRLRVARWIPLLLALLLSSAPAAINVGNFVWNDLNENGLQDPGEPGLPDVTVQLWNGTKTTFFSSTTTDANGRYSLIASGPGTYRVRIVLPGSFDRFTLKDAGGNDQNDSDINPSGADFGFTDIYTFVPNLISIITIDAGLIPDPMGSDTIGDRVFRANPDGTQPAAGTGGLSGVTVQLQSTGGTILQTTTTNNKGFYSFPASPGTYRLKFLTPAGLVPTPFPHAGDDDNNDSDIDSTGLTGTFTLAPGQVIRHLDAGFVNAINVGNFVWDDRNSNGLQDSGEPGLPNVTVQLWNGAKNRFFVTGRTGSGGLYSLIAPGPGPYRLRIVLPGNLDAFSPLDAGGDQSDSDINPSGSDTGFTGIYNFSTNLISITTIDAGVLIHPSNRPQRITAFSYLSPLQASLTFEGRPGTTYIIERSQNLLSWSQTGSAFTLDTVATTRTVSSFSFPGPSYRYFRVSRAP